MSTICDISDFCWNHPGPLPDISDLGDAVYIGPEYLPLNEGNAFMCLNSHVLTDSAPKRRVNREVAARNGSVGRRSRRTERVVDLEVRVVGYVDPDGLPYSDIREGCELNIDILRAATQDAAEDDYGCIPVRVVRKSGQILEGSIQVNDCVAAPGVGDRTAVMEVVLVDGYLTEATP